MKKEKRKNIDIKLLSNCWFMLRVAFKTNKTLFFIKIPVIFFTTFYPFLSAFFFKNILNEITTSGEWDNVLLNVIIMASVILVSEFIISVLTLQESKLTEKTIHLMKLNLGTSIMNIPYAELETPEMRDLISLAQNGNTFLQIINNITLLVSGVIKTVGLFSLIITVEPFILLVIILIFILQIVVEKRNQPLWSKWRSLLAPIKRKCDYYAGVMKELSFGKEVRVNNLKEYLKDKYENQELNEYIPTDMKRLKTIQNRYFPSNFSIMLQEGIAYLFLAYRVVFKNMLIGDFTFFLSIVGGFSEGIRAVKGSYWLLGRNGAFAKEFRHCIELSEQDSGLDDGQVSIERENITIEFINVSFRYPNTERMILKDISFKLLPNETLSIVGINGAGKTTLVKLLCRLYKPTSGEIRINNIPINDIKFSEYIKLIAAVFQDFKLFSFNVRENIVMVEGLKDTERLNQCIDKSGLKSKIESLSQGLDTMITKEFDETGIEFSGGESQKLAIARALYKDSPVVILDEPTAALDPIAEYEIYRRFQELTKNKIAIYISHRLSSTRFTDKIAVLADGELIEYGKHSELMQIDNGIYKNMFDMQAQNYKF